MEKHIVIDEEMKLRKARGERVGRIFLAVDIILMILMICMQGIWILLTQIYSS